MCIGGGMGAAGILRDYNFVSINLRGNDNGWKS
jgi:hypothetical protein